MPDDIPPLPVLDGGVFTRPLKVCFSVPEFLGFPNRGGIGQAYAAFAEVLAKAGHDVTVLIAADFAPGDPQMSVVEEGAKALGVHLVFLPEPPFRCTTVLNSGSHPIIAYRAWYWLKDRNFDVIHFTDYLTSGFFCVSEKRAGLGFQDTLLCVSLHSSSRWCREGDDIFISKFSMLETDFLEQRTAELADLVIVPSHCIAKWAVSNGWNLTAPLYHQCNLIRIPEAYTSLTTAAPSSVKEIVFFGRLQPRKGLLEFCEAIDQLDPALLTNVSITFLGSHVTAPMDSRSYLAQKTAAWSAKVSVLDQCSRDEALEYLLRPGVLAVLPSRVENSGMALYECLVLGIPFLAANVAGNPELIRPQDRELVLFEVSAMAIAKKLAAALVIPPQAIPSRSLPADCEARWVGWHNELAAQRSSALRSDCSPDALPRVSVCLVHYNQPELVIKAIESLEAQTYPNFEVVLVDDGSTQPEALAGLLEIEKRFAVRGWRVLRQENSYIGAARNHAAREANGEFLMFMDDDNIAKPEEIACFVKGSLTSGQDVVVSTMDCFEGMGDPLPAGHPGHWRQLFLGGPISAALFQNTLGDANFFVRRTVFESLGGFFEAKQITGEDQHFLAKAELAGHRILLIPESLYHYRIIPRSMYRTRMPAAREKIVITIFDDVVPPAMKDTLEYAFSLHKNNTPSGRKATALRDYRTVIDSSASDIGVEVYWGTGWFKDEVDQIWSGGEDLLATLLLNAKSPCQVDFCAHVTAAEDGNSLCITLNGEVLERRFEGQFLRIEALPLREGVNTLSFTPRLPPARVIPGDHRKLGYLFTRISFTPPVIHEQPGPVEPDLLLAVDSTDRTVLRNELYKIGAQAFFAEGWYDNETIRRWSGREGHTSSIIFQSPIEQRISLSADLSWISDGNSLRTDFHGETAHFDHLSKCLELQLTLKPDIINTLIFDTKLPPLSPGPQDPRELSFCLSNIQITLAS